MGYHLNRLDKPVFMAVSKPLLTEFGIHHRLESCGMYWVNSESWKHVLEISKKCKWHLRFINHTSTLKSLPSCYGIRPKGMVCIVETNIAGAKCSKQGHFGWRYPLELKSPRKFCTKISITDCLLSNPYLLYIHQELLEKKRRRLRNGVATVSKMWQFSPFPSAYP